MIDCTVFAVVVFEIIGGVHLDTRVIGGKIHEDAGFLGIQMDGIAGGAVIIIDVDQDAVRE